MNTIKYVYPIIFLILFSCGKSKAVEEDEHEEAPVEERVITVTSKQFENSKMLLGTIEEKPFATVVRAQGSIGVPPQSRAVISAFSGGYVKDLPIQLGQAVAKGARLVTLENPEFIRLQQEYVELSEQLSFLKSEYERQQIMLNEKITSQKSFLKAESDYKSALARQQSLKKNLEMLNISPSAASRGDISSSASIFSPIQGVVTAVFVNRGSYVSPADKILEVIQTEDILLELKVFEKDLLHLKTGQQIRFRIPEASSETFAGTVTLVGVSVDATSRMATVLGKITDKNDTRFSVGMFAEAEIAVSEQTFSALPESAIVEYDGVNYVLELQSQTPEEYHFFPKKVNIGKTYNGQVVIENSNDLKNKKILIDGGYFLLQEEGGGDSH